MKNISKYNYLEYIDNKLVLTNTNKNFSLNNLEINILKDFSILNMDLNNRIWEIKDEIENKIYKFLLRPIKSSGINRNHNKRIILNKKDYYDKDINIITYYPSSPSKFCFILSSSNEIYNNKNKNDKFKNTSIWYNFDCIYECLEYNKNICESKQNSSHKHKLYYSANLLTLLKKEYSIFETHNDSILAKEHYKQINENDEIINLFSNTKFKSPSKYIFNDNDIKKITYNDDKILGELAEKIFNHYLTHNKNFLSDLFNFFIKDFIWLNSEKESFLPYDFILNGNVYIDVKGTSKNRPYFCLSGNEVRFRENLSNNLDYYIVNVYDLNQKNDYKFELYSKNKLIKMNYIRNETLIFDERNEKNE